MGTCRKNLRNRTTTVIIYHNRPDQDVPIYLEDASGNPLLSIVPSQIQVFRWRESQQGFQSAGTCSSEAGDGWYVYESSLQDSSEIGIVIFQARNPAASENGYSVVDVIASPVTSKPIFRRPAEIKSNK